ncbi:hypothetical protein Tco_0283688, partial [Tanacetum coccineum]
DIDDDPLVSLVRESMKEKSTYFVTPTKASLALHQESELMEIIDIEDGSITKGKDEVVKEEEAEVSVKKTGMRRKQKTRKGINIDKTAQDEFNKKREAYVKDKVKYASSESEIGVMLFQLLQNLLPLL